MDTDYLARLKKLLADNKAEYKALPPAKTEKEHEDGYSLYVAIRSAKRQIDKIEMTDDDFIAAWANTSIL